MLCLPPLKAKKLDPMLMICGLVTAAGGFFGWPFVGIAVYTFIGEIEEGQDDEKKKYLLVGILGFIGSWVAAILTAIVGCLGYFVGALISIIMGLGMVLASMNDDYKAAYSTGDAAAAAAPAADAEA